VDQHAAHERVFFEDLSGRGAGPGQLLLEPAVVRLSGPQWQRWAERAESLAGVGLSAEPFGDGTLLVRALPAGLGADPAAALADLLEQMEPAGEAGLPAARIALAACRAAIKAGQPLGAADAAALLGLLAGCRDPFHCPHGRPTLLRIGWGALERYFGRR
jgi:DNA mismatch repair protein MutL